MNEWKLVDYPDVVRWIDYAPGEFSINDMMKFFLHGEFDNHASAVNIILSLEGLVKDGYLERVGTRRGMYRSLGR